MIKKEAPIKVMLLEGTKMDYLIRVVDERDYMFVEVEEESEKEIEEKSGDKILSIEDFLYEEQRDNRIEPEQVDNR